MKLHEYQAKQLFTSVGIPVPRGASANTPEQAGRAFEDIRRQCGAPSAFACSLKAQVHAGGRGKAGGILTVRSAQEAREGASNLLGHSLVTHQTQPEGLAVSVVLLEEQLAVARELYLAVTIDRFRAKAFVLASQRGGVDIEEVARGTPSAIVQEDIGEDGISDEGCRRISRAIKLQGNTAACVHEVARAMWSLFVSADASLVEINPLAVTREGRLIALDAKVTLDDNALFRHQDLAALRDISQEHPLELKASKIGISYVGLSGNIGCLVNGAGLAMATNDIIKLAGGSPANFLDVGGGADIEQVANAFSIILSDARVRATLVNIFGGIMRCDWIAQGLLNSTQTMQVKVPIVVRLQGTNVEEARRLLAVKSKLNLISVDDLEQAAHKAVELAKQA